MIQEVYGFGNSTQRTILLKNLPSNTKDTRKWSHILRTIPMGRPLLLLVLKKSLSNNVDRMYVLLYFSHATRNSAQINEGIIFSFFRSSKKRFASWKTPLHLQTCNGLTKWISRSSTNQTRFAQIQSILLFRSGFMLMRQKLWHMLTYGDTCWHNGSWILNNFLLVSCSNWKCRSSFSILEYFNSGDFSWSQREVCGRYFDCFDVAQGEGRKHFIHHLTSQQFWRSPYQTIPLRAGNSRTITSSFQLFLQSSKTAWYNLPCTLLFRQIQAQPQTSCTPTTCNLCSIFLYF